MPDDQQVLKEKERQRAVIRAWRAKSAAQQMMNSDSKVWNAYRQERQNENRPFPASMDELSRGNLARRRAHLRVLDDREKAFYDNFLRQPFYATHFTDNNLREGDSGHVSLISRRRLLAHFPKVDFDHHHTSVNDIEEGRQDDHVFFSLECGHQPQKLKSRFGDDLYRFNLDQGPFEHAWISLDDMVSPDPKRSKAEFEGMTLHDFQHLQTMFGLAHLPRNVLKGRDILPGLGLAVIAATRVLSEPGKAQLLRARQPGDVNRVMNTLFRPELKVARSVMTDRFEFIPASELQRIREQTETVDAEDKNSSHSESEDD